MHSPQSAAGARRARQKTVLAKQLAALPVRAALLGEGGDALVEIVAAVGLPDEVAGVGPIDPEIWVVASLPREDIAALYHQKVLEEIEARNGRLTLQDCMLRHWEKRPEWIRPLPDELGRYHFAEHTFREWPHMAEFVSMLVPVGDGRSEKVDVFIAVRRLYSD